MPNLRDIKDRIGSVHSTQKITRAMKMVAAAKVKKSENMAKAGRPFAEGLNNMFRRVYSSLVSVEKEFFDAKRPENSYLPLLEKREIKTAGYLLITSNKGLAGAYNANLVRFFLKTVEENNKNGIETKVFIVGQKGIAALSRRAKDYGFTILKTYTNLSATPNSAEAAVISDALRNAFIEREIDSIEVITTQFKNMMSYKVGCWKLLPIDAEKEHSENYVDPEMMFEPSLVDILRMIVPMYLTNLLYHALLEATASELASRMTAMSSATNNAQDIIKDLTVVYNKARQTAITQEILEVISGADALKH